MTQCWIYRGRKTSISKNGVSKMHTLTGRGVRKRQTCTDTHLHHFKIQYMLKWGSLLGHGNVKNSNESSTKGERKNNLFTKKRRVICGNSCIQEQKLFKQITRIIHSADVHRTKIWRNGKLMKTKQLYSKNGNGICAIPAKWKLRIISVFFCDLCMFLI